MILGLGLFLLIGMLKAQTVTLPDTNLRNALINRYPDVMQGNDLDIAKAAAYFGVLDLSNSNIHDATGIEYFTSIFTLALSNNELSTIPDISGTSGLLNFYASGNNITSIPGISSLTQLRDFQVMNNQLTQLPDLSRATQLTSLYCSKNQITQLPDLSLFPDLTHLVYGDNPIQGPVDVSSNPNLIQLHLHRTGTESIPGLDKLKKLTTLFAWGNQIKDFSGLDSNTTLTICIIFNNLMDELPYLENKPDLSELSVEECNLSFADIIPVLQDPPATFHYAPQKTMNVFSDIAVRDRQELNLSNPITSPDPGNWYVWSKGGNVLDSSSTTSFTIDPVSFSDSGTYSLKIYNSNVPDLVLNTNSFKVSVGPCLEFAIPFVDIIDEDCSEGYTIDLSGAQIGGGILPLEYQVSNNVFLEEYDEDVIENLPAGKYTITAIDAQGCMASDSIVLNRIENCDPVLTPNGDGIADSYYIEESGQAKIYDLRRKLIKTIRTPASWDGTNENGSLVDSGLYILILNDDTPIHVTIIR